MGLIKEFKEFAMKGNVMDMAIGVIIGAAFGKIVSSLVDDVLMPLVGMIVGKVDFTTEPWAKRVLFREDIDGHTAFTVSITEPVTLQKFHRLLQLTAKAALKEGADMIDAALVSYGDIAAAPVDALATMVAEKEAPRVIVQGVLDYDDLPAAGETKEVVIPLTRPKFTRKIGTLTLLVQG